MLDSIFTSSFFAASTLSFLCGPFSILPHSTGRFSLRVEESRGVFFAITPRVLGCRVANPLLSSWELTRTLIHLGTDVWTRTMFGRVHVLFCDACKYHRTGHARFSGLWTAATGDFWKAKGTISELHCKTWKTAGSFGILHRPPPSVRVDNGKCRRFST